MPAQDLEALPLRGLVAFVGRCALRLRPALEFKPPEPLLTPRSDVLRPNYTSLELSVAFSADAAIRAASLFSSGRPVSVATANAIATLTSAKIDERAGAAFYPPNRHDPPVAVAALTANLTAQATAEATRAAINTAPEVRRGPVSEIARRCYASVEDAALVRAMDRDIERLLGQASRDGDLVGPSIDMSLGGPLNGYWPDLEPYWYELGHASIERRHAFVENARATLRVFARDLGERDHKTVREECAEIGHRWPQAFDDWNDLSIAALALRWEVIWRLRPDLPTGDNGTQNPFLQLGDCVVFIPEEGNTEAAALVASAHRIEVTRPLSVRDVLTGYTQALSVLQRPDYSAPADDGEQDLRRQQADSEERISRILLRGNSRDAASVLQTYIDLTRRSELAGVLTDQRAARAHRDVFRAELAPLLALAWVRARDGEQERVLKLVASAADDAGLSGSQLRSVLAKADPARREASVELFLAACAEEAPRVDVQPVPVVVPRLRKIELHALPAPRKRTAPTLPYWHLMTEARLKGHEGAPAELVAEYFDVYGSRIRGYLTAAFRCSDEDAKDVMQEAFARLYETLRDGKLVESPRNWLFTEAHREMRKRLETNRIQAAKADDVARHLVASASERLSPEEAAALEERSAMFQRAMFSLSDTERQVLRLRAEGLKVREIAKIVGLSSGRRVSALLRHALQKLTDLVGGGS